MILHNAPKKHIVLLTDCFADLAGGAERQIYELIRGLDKNLYTIHIVSLDCWGQAPRALIESTGSHLHIFRVVRIYGISGLLQGLRFKHFLRENRIDILMTYHFSSDIWGTFWGQSAGVKTIISNRRDLGFWRNGLHVAAYKSINRWVNKIVMNSQSIKEMVVKEEGVDPGRIEVIYNGVQLPEKVGPAPQVSRARLGLKDDDIVIMHVANLKPVKGHQYLLEAFAALEKERPDLKLVLIGRDEVDGQVQNTAQGLNILDKVLFMGKQDNVQSLLSLADICVLPSLSEGMSNAILEYMAAGKPVIATNVGGNPEMIKNGCNGLLVDSENAQQLKNALLILINDPQKRLDMGRAGHERVKKEFSIPAMLSRYGSLFSKSHQGWPGSVAGFEKAPGIKILHLISSGGLFGAERVVLNLASKADGITSLVGAINNIHNPHLEIIDEARHLKIDTVVFDSKGKFDWGTINAVKKFIIKHKVDIVHTHNYKSDFVGVLAAKFTGAKWMATHHGWTGADHKLEFYERIDSFILKHSQKVVLVSQKVKKDFGHLKEKHLEVIDNGVPIEKFDRSLQAGNTRSSLGIRPEDRAIVIVGRLSPEKGHDVFLKAAFEAVKDVQNVKFIVVGDGPLREELEQKTLDLNLSDCVFFTGVREDMPAVYAACDILVNSSYAEGLPMTILEAMASHLPVIATDVGGVGEVIKNEENGILLPPGDVRQLALRMVELARDKEKCRRLGLKAYQDVCARFSDTIMARKYKQVYEDVIWK